MGRKIANLIAFIVGVYFIIRAYFLYTKTSGDIGQNKFVGIIYFCIGILAIIIQLVINYRKKK